MQDHSDWYWFFHDYWWLLFPAGWAIGQLIKNWMRHNRAKEALSMLKSYADQGKEPPPELIAMLRQPEQAEMRKGGGMSFGTYGWIIVFLFAASACATALMAIFPPDPMARIPMIMGAITCVGLALGFLAAMQAHKRQDRNPPQ
jgi:hypothetical protein